jgi:hypothetical protein
MTNWTIKVLDIIACVLSGPFKREKWSMLGCMYKICTISCDKKGKKYDKFTCFEF